MNIEQQVAQQLAHQERTAKILQQTGGEAMHPDLFFFRENFRVLVLSGMDDSCHTHSMPEVKDCDLPELFKTIDALAERLWLRRFTNPTN